MRIVCGSRLCPGLEPIEIVESYKFMGKIEGNTITSGNNPSPISNTTLQQGPEG